MNTLEQLIKSLGQSQQKIGLPHKLDLGLKAVPFNKNFNHQVSLLNGLSGISNLSKSIALQNRKWDKSSLLLGQQMSMGIGAALAKQGTLNKVSNPFSQLSGSIDVISKYNSQLSSQISYFTSTQLKLTNSLIGISKIFSDSHLQKFNSLSLAINGISNDYLHKTAISKEWSNLDKLSEINEVIVDASKELVTSDNAVTKEDLEVFKKDLINTLTPLLSKYKSGRTRQLVMDLMNTICFLITMYQVGLVPVNRMNSEEIKNEITQQIDSKLEDIGIKEFSSNYKIKDFRVSRTNVNLRFSTNKRSKKVGLIQKGHDIIVRAIRHKWLLVSYIDLETQEPKSGFAMKKYFERI
jgi:hypothetical protein